MRGGREIVWYVKLGDRPLGRQDGNKVKVMKKYTQPGFTLIELLLVISIIAVLMGMMLPTLAAARKTAHASRCAANMKQFMLVEVTYAFDNKGMLPYTNSEGGEALSNPNRWVGAGWLYKGPINEGSGPDYSQYRREEGAMWDYLNSTAEVYHCTLDDAVTQDYDDSRNLSSYVMNRAVNGWNQTLPGRPAHLWESFANPASSVAMWEGDETFSNLATGEPGTASGHWNDGNNDPDSQGPSLRHNNAGTVGFLDGHAEAWSWLRYFEAAFPADDTVPNELFCNPGTDNGRQP